MVLEHQGEHDSKRANWFDRDEVRCTAATLQRWMRQAERDRGLRAGLTMEERDPIKALEREVKVLRQAKEILRKASANFAEAECGNGIPTRHRGGYSVMPC